MLVIDKFYRKPIYEQIVEGIEYEIITGNLKARDQLPSIRELSAAHAVNPNTIQKAFLELDRAGVIISNQGRGCFVSDDAMEKIRERLRPRLAELENLAGELFRAGITREEVLRAVENAFSANEK